VRWVQNALPYLAVAAGAMVGANLRYALSTWMVARFGAGFPYGTFFINVSGAFVIGVFLALLTERVTLHPLWRPFFATGLLGGYTTFSSYTWEALALARGGDWLSAVAYVGGSNALGLAGVWLGAMLVSLLR